MHSYQTLYSQELTRQYCEVAIGIDRTKAVGIVKYAMSQAHRKVIFTLAWFITWRCQSCDNWIAHCHSSTVSQSV